MKILIDIVFLLIFLFMFYKVYLVLKEEHEIFMKMNRSKQEFYETMTEYYKSDLVR